MYQNAKKYTDSLQRNYMDFGIPKLKLRQDCSDVIFFRICGITDFWLYDDINIDSIMADIISAISGNNNKIIYAIIGDKNGINIYFGVSPKIMVSMMSSLKAMYPGVKIEEISYNPTSGHNYADGGIVIGIPTNKSNLNDASQKSFQIENICRGMFAKNFIYMVTAVGVSDQIINSAHKKILDEMGIVYREINQNVSGGVMGNISADIKDYHAEYYLKNLEYIETSLRDGVGKGLWQVSCYYGTDSTEDATKLGKLIKASFSGDKSLPEPIRAKNFRDIPQLISSLTIYSDFRHDIEDHPIGIWTDELWGDNQIQLFKYHTQTVLNTEQLAVMMQLPVKEFPGYYINEYAEFDLASRNNGVQDDVIELGDISVVTSSSDNNGFNKYIIDKNDLARHALIIGITGGGKTNTSKSLFNSLWAIPKNEKRIPFLVIESAKREYWELANIKGYEELCVFTLGDESKETSVKYRLNPFETTRGISLQTHIDYLLSTFKAAFDLFAPLPFLLETAIYEIYDDRGWDVEENINRYGLSDYPTLQDLANKVDVVIERMGYHKEVESNMKAALSARINSLLIGGKGAMLNCRKSIPIQMILNKPAVFELEDLGDDDTKSFVIGMLLVQLYEYRKSIVTSGPKTLQHILLIEEAHRLLKNYENRGTADTRAKAVEFFCNMLAEIRTFGQGIIIADQIPTKLAPDTMKNTNLKIVHRTVAEDDRKAIGNSMNMNAPQIDYLSSLHRGYAAVYAEGDNRPKCVKFPLVCADYNYNRREVMYISRKNISKFIDYEKYTVKEKYSDTYFSEEAHTYREEILQTFRRKRTPAKNIYNKWKQNDYSVYLIDSLISQYGFDNKSMTYYMAVMGVLLENDNKLTTGKKQALIAEYLKHYDKRQKEM